MEAANDGFHFFAYPVIAQITDGAFMSMMDIPMEFKFSGKDVQAYFLVRIPERNTFLPDKTVHLLHTERRLIFGIIHYASDYFHIADGIGSDVQAVVQFLENRDEYFFKYLQITEIA